MTGVRPPAAESRWASSMPDTFLADTKQPQFGCLVLDTQLGDTPQLCKRLPEAESEVVESGQGTSKGPTE